MVNVLEACEDGDLRLAHVQKALIHEEMKINEKLGEDTSTLSVKQTSSTVISLQRNYKPWKPKYYVCGQPDHFRHNCSKRREHSSPEGGHKARTAGEKCLGPAMTKDKSDSEMLDTVEAFTASISLALHQMDKWLINSGTSSHMTSQRNIPTNYKEFMLRQNVNIGNGRTVNTVVIENVHVNK